jgi:hypothetical protein
MFVIIASKIYYGVSSGQGIKWHRIYQLLAEELLAVPNAKYALLGGVNGNLAKSSP